jgi:hypothetical protein
MGEWVNGQMSIGNGGGFMLIFKSPSVSLLLLFHLIQVQTKLTAHHA